MLGESTKIELRDLCERIAKLMRIRQGSVEIHCKNGEPKQVHLHEKSIRFEDDKPKQ